MNESFTDCSIELVLSLCLCCVSDAQDSKREQRRASLESQQVGGEFAEFLKTLKKPAALDVSKQVKAFIEKVQAMGEALIDDISELVQDFYQNMSDRITTHTLYRGEKLHGSELVGDFVENMCDSSSRKDASHRNWSYRESL